MRLLILIASIILWQSFNSRTPGGVRPSFSFASAIAARFQFTHPGRGATRRLSLCHRPQAVSIHAPREGCDFDTSAQRQTTITFQFTHPGRGATHSSEIRFTASFWFQFTHPGRGATGVKHIYLAPGTFQFTHPGRGATPVPVLVPVLVLVSIHAPREGCDFTCLSVILSFPMFQFTHPGRGATSFCCYVYYTCNVSIHAPREGCDTAPAGGGCFLRVSIHAPREGCDGVFLWVSVLGDTVSIHAPREGCDSIRTAGIVAPLLFQFTHPGRGATDRAGFYLITTKVSIHAPREGCDHVIPHEGVAPPLFQFTHPGRGATVVFSPVSHTHSPFQFTHPGRGATY